MSNSNNKLEALFLKLKEVESDLTIKNLLEAMGFFALRDLYETVAITQNTVTQTLESYSGSAFVILRKMFEPFEPKEKRKTINTSVRQGFTSLRFAHHR